MNDFGALILAVALVLGLFFGLRFFILWKAKKVIGRNFTDLSEGIVYFYSPKCGACKRMEPTIEKLSKEVQVLKIDVTTEEGEKLAKEFGIVGTPTIFVVKNGRIEKVIIGTRDYEELKRELTI